MSRKWPEKPCRTCGRPIYLVRTRNGTWEPFDVQPFEYHRCGDPANYAVSMFVPRSNRYDNPSLIRAEPLYIPEKTSSSAAKRATPVHATIENRAIKTPARKPMAVCPICGVSVRASRLNKHIQTVHGQHDAVGTAIGRSVQNAELGSSFTSLDHPAKRAMTTCSVCGVAVREDRLTSHFGKVHSRIASTDESSTVP